MRAACRIDLKLFLWTAVVQRICDRLWLASIFPIQTLLLHYTNKLAVDNYRLTSHNKTLKHQFSLVITIEVKRGAK